MPGDIADTEALRAAAPHSAVVVLTPHDDAATREQAREEGLASGVAKPRTEGILLAAIRGVALANAKRRRRGCAPAIREEEHTDAMRDRRGA
jgi:DNA-binding NarL/FixJ family response regulator